MIRLIYTIIFFFLIFPNILFAKTNPLNNEYKQNNILNFAKDLISQSEYYRAFVEIKRLNSFYPGFLSEIKIFTTESYLYFQSKKYDVILGKGDTGALTPFRNPEKKNKLIEYIDKIFKFDSFINLESNNISEMLLNFLPCEIKDFNHYFFKRELYWSLVKKKYNLLKKIYKKYPGIESDEYKNIINFAKSETGRYRSPALATILGLVPGLGYIYAGEIGTGIVSFLMISVCTVITYFAVTTGNEAIGVMVGAVGTFFYAGSMAGGYFAAKRYNRKINSYRDEFLKDELNFSKDRESIFEKYGIGTNAKKE